MRPIDRATAAAAAVLSVDVAVLIALRPHPTQLGQHLRGPHAWITRDGVDAALVTVSAALIWLVAAWLLVALVAGLACRLPGPAGRCARTAWFSLVPALLRRGVSGALGLGLLTTGVATVLAPGVGPLGSSAAAAPVSSAIRQLPAPQWPQTPPGGRVPATSAGEHRIPAPRWPADRATRAAKHRGTQHSSGRHSSKPVVTVRPGDSLWLLTAARLGPAADRQEVAAAWPRWYAANRAVVGADPDLITPGQVLHAPPDTSRGERR